MGDSDAEWVGVDYEFGKRDPPHTTKRPVPRATTQPPRPLTERPVRRPHDAPEVEPPATDPIDRTNTVTIASAAVGGVLGIVLLSLLIYMLVLRRRLNKAKVASTDAQYQLRVEDVAHLTHLDETSNTYVNTTDLQKLMSSVRAKKKSEERPPTMPKKIQPQMPMSNRSAPNPQPQPIDSQSNNSNLISDPEVVVVRAPMPLPHNKTDLQHNFNQETCWKPKDVPKTEALYSNIESPEPFMLEKPPPRKKGVAPAAAPPPPPTKQKDNPAGNTCEPKKAPVSQIVIARSAPPPPVMAKTKSVESMEPSKMQKPLLPEVSKPTPPVAPKPNKVAQRNATAPKPVANKPVPPVTRKPNPPLTSKPTPPQTYKPTPPVALKPGLAKKGKGLPPLKMALLPSLSRSSLDNCSSPDTGTIELTPENTPTPHTGSTGSISSKIALLEGKMKTPVLPARALQQKT